MGNGLLQREREWCQESDQSCISVLTVFIFFLFTIIRINFGTVTIIWYWFCICLALICLFVCHFIAKSLKFYTWMNYYYLFRCWYELLQNIFLLHRRINIIVYWKWNRVNNSHQIKRIEFCFCTITRRFRSYRTVDLLSLSSVSGRIVL